MAAGMAPARLAPILVLCALAGYAPGQDGEARVALVTAESARVFTMEADKPDVTFPDFTLTRGTPVYFVKKGISCEGTGPHFVAVRFLDGFEAWAHSRYITVEPEGGYGVVSGVRTSLRLRTRRSSQHLHAGTVKAGTRLRLLEKVGGWWKVRSPKEATAWMLLKDLELLTSAKSAPAIAAYRKKLEQERAAARREAAERQARAARRKTALAGLATINRIVQAEQTRTAKVPARVTDKAAVTAEHETLKAFAARFDRACKAFRETFPQKEWGALDLEEEVARVLDPGRTLVRTGEGWMILNPIPKAAGPKPPPPPTNNPVGFLTRLEEPPYMTPFALTKGGRVVCYLQCTSGRYTLNDFKGCRIEVSRFAKTTVPSLKGLPLVDVQRMVVLNHP